MKHSYSAPWMAHSAAAKGSFAGRGGGNYYATLKGLDLAMGAQNFTPHNPIETAGRRIAKPTAPCPDGTR